jgi:hypothetical protein
MEEPPCQHHPWGAQNLVIHQSLRYFAFNFNLIKFILRLFKNGHVPLKNLDFLHHQEVHLMAPLQEGSNQHLLMEHFYLAKMTPLLLEVLPLASLP